LILSVTNDAVQALVVHVGAALHVGSTLALH
jgi:hypothetical protein